ncbi:unnamed protein product [Arctogadus glacialis]
MNGDANRREGGEVKAFSDAEHTPEAAVQNAPPPPPPPHQGHNPAAMRRLGEPAAGEPVTVGTRTMPTAGVEEGKKESLHVERDGVTGHGCCGDEKNKRFITIFARHGSSW